MADRAVPPNTETAVPLPNVIKFVRQLSHDLRNSLNAAELQAAYISEIAEAGEIKEEMKRLREMVSELGTSLQKLTSALADVRLNPMEYAAADFVDDLRQKVASQFPEASDAFEWQVASTNSATLEIDPQLLQQGLLELFDNALRHRCGAGRMRIEANVGNGQFAITIAEPKTEFSGDPQTWGHEPLKTLSHGHYGLGLHRARRIIAAHSGELDIRYDRGGGCLMSTVRLPLSKEGD